MLIINLIINVTNLMKQNHLEQFNISNNCMYSGLQGTCDKHVETSF